MHIIIYLFIDPPPVAYTQKYYVKYHQNHSNNCPVKQTELFFLFLRRTDRWGWSYTWAYHFLDINWLNIAPVYNPIDYNGGIIYDIFTIFLLKPGFQ